MYTGRITTGLVQADHDPQIDRIVANGKDNWDTFGCRFSDNCRSGVAKCGNDRNVTVDEVGYQIRVAVVVAFCPAIFDQYVFAFRKSRFAKALAECTQSGCFVLSIGHARIADHRHRRLLRACRKRPCYRRTANKREELASPHVPPLAKTTLKWTKPSTPRLLQCVT